MYLSWIINICSLMLRYFGSKKNMLIVKVGDLSLHNIFCWTFIILNHIEYVCYLVYSAYSVLWSSFEFPDSCFNSLF